MRLPIVLLAALSFACGGVSSSNTNTQPPPNQLAAPSNLAANPGNATVSLTWSAVDGAQSYEVRRALTNTAATLLGAVTVTAFADTAAVNGSLYTYSVRAVGPSGGGTDSTLQFVQPFRAVCVSSNADSLIAVFNGEDDIDTNTRLKATRTFGGQTGLAPLAIAADFQHGQVFAANQGGAPLSGFSLAASGNVAPSSNLTDPANEFHWDIAYDPAGDHVLVATVAQVKTFQRPANGAAAPLVQTLTVSDGTSFGVGKVLLSGPAHGDRMFVVSLNDQQTIRVFKRTDADPKPPATGGVHTPTATITSPVAFARRAFTYDPVTDELVAGSVGRVTAFAASSQGQATATRTLIVDQTGLTGVTALAVDSSRNLLYVADSSGQISTWPLDFADGSTAAASAVLSGPSTMAGTDISTMEVDEVSGNLVVQSADSILVFGSAPSGDQAPLSAITSAGTGVESPGGLAFDKAHGELLVTNSGARPAITTFDGTASGFSVTPLRSLAVPNEVNIFTPPAMALAPARDELVYANGADGQIAFYARGATGNAAALRTIAGSKTNLFWVWAVAVDAANDAVVVNDFGTIRRFAMSFTDGNQAPLNSITTPFSAHAGVAVDGGEIFVANETGVAVYRLTDSGNATPVRTLTVAGGAEQVIVDTAANEIFVMANDAQEIDVFPRNASGGNVQPQRRIMTFAYAFKSLLTGMAFCN